MTLSAGIRLGPYEIVAPLGAGGMGEVYRARDRRLERDVAIKVLPERLAFDRQALERFGALMLELRAECDGYRTVYEDLRKSRSEG